MKIVNIVGARPNFMKIAPLMREYAQYAGRISALLFHTGQHYDQNMSSSFFEELDIRAPDEHLGVGAGSHAEQTAKVMVGLEPLFLRERPDWVVVVGDVNSTLAAAIVASKLGIRVAHVEAGLRSFDRAMPEEINRIVTDALSDCCFASCPDAIDNLRREGVAQDRIVLAGNVMIDTLLHLKPRALASQVRSRLGLPERFAYATLHRPSNVDDRASLERTLACVDAVLEALPVVLPLHPRTAARIKELGFMDRVAGRRGLTISEPLGYLDSLCLIANAEVVVTDSGGIQEESTVLGVPCLTMRENTERPITIEEGTNTLVGSDVGRLRRELSAVLAGKGKRDRRPALWDGRASERIVKRLLGS